MLRFAIERGVILSVFISILCLFGLVAIFRVPVQMVPDIEPRVISVQTVWPGATPLEIESEILMEQEKYLRKLTGLIQMTSSTSGRGGSASIDLEFSSDTDLQEALVRVNSALSQVASYPENVDPPRMISSDSSQSPFIFIALIPDDLNQYSRAELSTLLDKHIATRLERIPGVAQVRIFGESAEQVHLLVDPEKLAARGITIAQLRQAVRNRNQDMSGGDIDSGKRRYVIRTKGRFQNLEAIANTVISERDGYTVKIQDIGEVSLASAEQQVISYMSGRQTLLMGISKTPGTNVVETLDEVNLAIEELNQGILQSKNVRLDLYSEDVRYVKNAISVVQKNLLLGGILACLVLYLFLHSAIPTLVGALGVPICTIGAFLGLLAADRTLNVISLAGIAFAIGMTLDNSIVVLENIFRHRAMGKKGFQAAIDGVSEVWIAVLASTLTTIFVFTPIVLIEDEVGQLYSDIAIAMSAAIMMSMIIAVTAMPSILARLPESAAPEAHLNNPVLKPFIAFAGKFNQRFFAVTEQYIQSTKARLMIVGGVLLFCVLIITFLTPQAEYLPEGEESKVFTRATPPTGYNINEVDKIGKVFSDLLVPHIGADGTAFKKGETPVPPMDDVFYHVSSNALFGVTEPIDPAHADALIDAIYDEMNKISGMLVFVSRGSIFTDSRGGARSIQLNIYGADINTIFETALICYRRAQEVFPKGRLRPEPGLNLSQPTLEIFPDWERAAELGLNASELGYIIWSLSDGAYLDDYILNDEEIDIYLYSTKGTVNEPQDIASLPIYTPSGSVVPLSALADIRQTVSPNVIRRVDARRTVTLNIVPPRDIALETAVDMVQRDIVEALQAEGKIPEDIDLIVGGASDKLNSARNALSGNMLIALALSYLLMVAIFSHWGYPLIILLAIPMGFSGGMIGLWLMNLIGINTPFDMITMLGIIVLIGTVVNNPILLVEQTRRYIKEGLAIQEAVLQSLRIRLRPIMMSMLTTIFGLSPVVFLAGAGTELYRGLGAIVLFGLMFSTLMTLTFIPSLLSLVLEGAENWRQRYAKNVDQDTGKTATSSNF